MSKKTHSSSDAKKPSSDSRTGEFSRISPKGCAAAKSASGSALSQKDHLAKANKHMTKAWGILSNQKGK